MTPLQRPDPGLLRRAIQSAIPGEDLQYFPSYFARALERDVSLVTGIRGSGKSELCRALGRRSVTPASLPDGYPDKDTLQKLLQSQNSSPRLIWKTVLLVQLGHPLLLALASWQASYSWVQEHPEEVAGYLGVADLELQRQNKVCVLLLDHFEQMADALRDRVRLLRGVLELIQELRAFATLRVKAFVNSDLLAQPGVSGFPGAARVLGSQVELRWQPADLYGLLYCKLGGISDLEARQHFQSLMGGGWGFPSTPPPYWMGGTSVMHADWQQALFGYLHQGGLSPASLSWFHKLPQDLTDSLGRISPRSFLLAVRTAAEHYREGFPLLAQALQAGILAAARKWKQELNEELPWAHQAMDLLKEQWVPLQPREVFALWRKHGFKAPSAESEGRASTEYDYQSALEGLQQLGALSLMTDGRIEVPELYRLGFRLGRRGGFRLV